MKRKLLFALIGILISLVMTVPVLAMVYTSQIVVNETLGNSYSMLPIVIPADIVYIIGNGYTTTTTGLDTRIESFDLAMPHLLADDKIIFAVPVNANSTSSYEFSTGNAQAYMNIVLGDGGYVTVPNDDVNLLLGDQFEIIISAWVDTDAAAGKYIFYALNEFIIEIDDTTDGTISAIINGGATASVTDVETAWHKIRVSVDGSNMTLIIDEDDAFKDVAAIGGIGVPDNDADWILFDSDVTPYVTKFKVYIN